MNEKFILLKKYIKENNYNDFAKELEQSLNEKNFDINYQYEYNIQKTKGNKVEKDFNTTTKHTLLHIALKLDKLLFVKRLLELNANPAIVYSKNGTVITTHNDGYRGNQSFENNSSETISKNITADKLLNKNIPLLALLKVYGLEFSTDTMNQKNKEEFDVYYSVFLKEKESKFLKQENKTLKSKLIDLDKVYKWKKTEESAIKIQSIFLKIGAKRKLEELQEAARSELKNKATKIISKLFEKDNYKEVIDLTQTLADGNYQLLKEKIVLLEASEKNIDIDLIDAQQPPTKKLKLDK